MDYGLRTRTNLVQAEHFRLKSCLQIPHGSNKSPVTKRSRKYVTGTVSWLEVGVLVIT